MWHPVTQTSPQTKRCSNRTPSPNGDQNGYTNDDFELNYKGPYANPMMEVGIYTNSLDIILDVILQMLTNMSFSLVIS